MAYLGKYIRQILSKKEAVVLPGFGSLVFEEGKGVRSDDGRIDPPGAVIRFDATQPNDNGRLAEEYAAGEQMDPEEARQQVLELVDAIRFKLDKGERYKLDTVGEFSRDDDNRIHFAKDPNWVIDPGLFGLSSLDLLELENEEEPVEEQDAEVAGATAAPGESKEGAGGASGVDVENADTTEEETPATGTTEEAIPTAGEKEGTAIDKDREVRERAAMAQGARTGKDKDTSLHPPAPMKTRQKGKAPRQPVRRWRVIWIVAGLLIAVLALILLIPSDNGLEVGKDGIIIRDTEIGNEGTEGTAQGSGQQPVVGTDAQEDPDAGAAESLQDQEFEDGPAHPPVKENRYFIIAGSFQNLGNATEMADELKAAGYPAEIILTENRLYRVSVKSFATKQEALNALPALKASDGLNNSWLLSR